MDRTDSSSAMMLLQYGNEDSDEDISFNESDNQPPPTINESDTQPPLSSNASDTQPPPPPPPPPETKETDPEQKPVVPEAPVVHSQPESPEKRQRHSSSKDSDSLSPGRRVSEDSFTRSAGLISDEEIDHHFPDSRFRKRAHEEDEDVDEGLSAVPVKLRMIDVKIAPHVSPIDVDSGASLPDSQRSRGSSKKGRREPTVALVSYGADDMDDEEGSSQSEAEVSGSEGGEDDDLNDEPSASPRHKGPLVEADDIQLPPEPPGKCSKALQDKITELYFRMKTQGFDTNYEIQRLTSFRNPSIYEKLIQMHHIDERGTNFKQDVFNPKMWGKDSYYDELDKQQKREMERREKEKKEKTKIEFVSGTKKSAPSAEHSHSSAASISEDKKRKSKWDALPPGLPSQPPIHRSGSGSNMAAAASSNLTTSASGTRATVISAVGTLTKKAPYNVINSSSSGGSFK